MNPSRCQPTLLHVALMEPFSGTGHFRRRRIWAFLVSFWPHSWRRRILSSTVRPFTGKLGASVLVFSDFWLAVGDGLDAGMLIFGFRRLTLGSQAPGQVSFSPNELFFAVEKVQLSTMELLFAFRRVKIFPAFSPSLREGWTLDLCLNRGRVWDLCLIRGRAPSPTWRLLRRGQSGHQLH